MAEIVNLADYKARRTFAALLPFLAGAILLLVFLSKGR